MMKSLIRLGIVAGSSILPGCGEGSGPKQTNSVFNITASAPLPDGRPVIAIQPNGQPRPTGTGPSGGYVIMVRKNGRAYYTRWFHADEAAKGLERDLAIPPNEVKPGDNLTVDIENVNPNDPTDYVLLSNVLDVPPPSASAPSFAIPSPKDVE